MKYCIGMEGPKRKRVVYKLLRSKAECLNSRVKNRLTYSRLTGQGLENASIHVSLILIVYAAAIVAALIGRPELRYSIAYFA